MDYETGSKGATLIYLAEGDEMETSPWHSNQPRAKVYHNNTKCPSGKKIEPQNRQAGDGGKRLCEECERLNRR